MERQKIDVFLDELFRHEMAAGIEKAATPCETGRVLDRDRRQAPLDTLDSGFPEDLRRQQLPHRLHGVEQPGVLGCPRNDSRWSDLEDVPLAAQAAERL